MTSTKRDEFIEWARRSAHPITMADEAAVSEELAFLDEIVRDARIIALGESWHSTAELLAIKNLIARHLVERCGFNAIVFEGGMPGTPESEAFALDGKGSAQSALLALGQPMWLNNESVSLVEWVRKRNENAPAGGAVHVWGLDPAYPLAAIPALMAYLEKVGAPLEPDNAAILSKFASELRGVKVNSAAKSAVWGTTGVYENFNPEEQGLFQAACGRALTLLAENQYNFTHRTSEAEYAWMMRQATVLGQALDIARIRSRSLTTANIVRDHAFAENLKWKLDAEGEHIKAVVLAHNIHVAREPFLSAGDDTPVPSMGAYLADWLGQGYVAIGSVVGRGRNIGAEDFGLVGDVDQPESNDSALEEVGLAAFLLPTGGAPGWAAQKRLTRSHLAPQPEYELAKSFDAVVYVDRITRCNPLALPD